MRYDMSNDIHDLSMVLDDLRCGKTVIIRLCQNVTLNPEKTMFNFIVILRENCTLFQVFEIMYEMCYY